MDDGHSSGPDATTGPTAHGLDGPTWVLVALDEGPIALERMPTLGIGVDGEVGGLAGCNRYRGPAVIGEGTISVGPLARTRMLCPAPLMALEKAFLAALENVSEWRRDGDSLELRGEDGVVRLVFRRAGDPGSA